MNPLCRTARHRCGFSLVELVAVLVMAAILAAVAVPAMGELGGSRAREAARLLARDLTYARELAMARGLTVWVSVNAGTETYTLLAETPGSPGRSGATTLTDPATGATFVRTLGAGEFAGVEITSAGIDGGSEIGFDWMGRPKNQSGASLGAVATILLSGPSGNGVSIQPETGFVRVLP